MVQYFTNSGGAADVIKRRAKARADAQKKAAKEKKSSGGFSLGDLVPDLGLGQMVKEISMIPTGLLSIATGKGGYSNALGGLAKGIASSALGTASTAGKVLGIPGTTLNVGDKLIEPLGEQLTGIKPKDFLEKARERGILPALVEDVGNVALVGAAASKLAKSGNLGALANAEAQVARLRGLPGDLQFSAAAEKAKSVAQKLRESGAADAFTPEQIAQRAQTIERAQQIAHPYKSTFQKVISPVARAGEAESLLRAPGAAAVPPDVIPPVVRTPAQPPVPKYATVDDILPGGQLDPALTSRAAPAPDVFSTEAPRVGPTELSASALQSAQIPEWAQRFASKSPDSVVEMLRKTSGFISGRQVRKVGRERQIFQEAERRKLFNEAPVKNLRNEGDKLVGQFLDDGTEITREMVDGLIGDEMVRQMAYGPLLKTIQEQVGTQLDVDEVIGAGPRIPEGLRTPELDQAIADAAEFFAQDVNQRRLEVLRGSRRGNEGIENAGKTNVELSKKDRTLWRQSRDLYAKAAKLDKRIPKDRARATSLLTSAQQKLGAIDNMNATLRVRSAEIANEIADLHRRGRTGGAVWGEGDVLRGLGSEPGALPDRSVRQLANTTRAIRGSSEAFSQRRGVTLERKATEHANIQQQIAENMSRRVRLQAGLDEIKRTLVEHDLKSEIEQANLTGKATKKVARLQRNLDNPSVSQVSAHWQPLYSAVTDLFKIAEKDPALANMLGDLPKTFSDVVRFSREQGFEPAHIASLTGDDVRKLVFEQVRLGRSGTGDVSVTAKAGTRNARTTGNIRTRSLSALAAGMFQATHEANSNAAIDFLQNNYAVPRQITSDGQVVLPDGWRLWDPDAHFKVQGAREDGAYIVEPNTGQRAPSMMIPEQVGKVLDSMSERQRNPLLGAISKFTNPWRAAMLTWVPRWYVNNILGNVLLATKEGVRIQDWVSAWNEQRKGEGISSTLTGNSIVSDIGADLGGRPQMFDFSGRFGEKVKTAKRQEGIGGAYRQVAKSVTRANEFVDELARTAVYHRTMRVGGTTEQALIRAQTAMIDYGNLTPFERQYVRSVVPFYAWQKNVLKMVSLYPIDHPAAAGVMMQLNALNDDLNERQYGGRLPEAYAGLVTIMGKTINTRAWNPFQDADQLTTPQGIAASVNPLVDTAIRNAYGAPDGGFVHHARANEFGTYVPDTSPAEDLGRVVTGLPQLNLGTTLATGESQSKQGRLQTGLRFGGVPVMTPEQIAKVVARARKTEDRLAGARASGYYG